MKKILFVLALLGAVGCQDDPELKCDYCQVLREGALRYNCEACKKTHVACSIEKSILGFVLKKDYVRPSWDDYSLKNCPPPREASLQVEPPALLPIRAEDHPPTEKKRPLSDPVFFTVICILVGLGCYAKGRLDQGRVRGS